MPLYNPLDSTAIIDETITTSDILDGTIAASDLATGAVTTAKILDATIATADLADGAVTFAKIADGAIGFGFPSTVLGVLGVSATAQAWTASNRAYWFRVRDGGSITTLGLTVGTSSGNVSFSIHAGTAGRNAPGASRWTSGAIACPSTGDQTVSLGATVAVQSGDWIGMSCDNTSATFRTGAPGIGNEAWITGLVHFKDTSHPIAAGTPSGTAGRGDKLVVIYGA